MKLLYNFLNTIFQVLFPVIRLISPKMKRFVDGRKETSKLLHDTIFIGNDWLWFHCASLGEYEQAVPLIKELKGKGNKILVSFFSPSGYEQKKNHELIDLAIYLPIDTPENACYLVEKVKPKRAFFIKYEFWENYFSTLNKNQIPIYMVSSTFRFNQPFFKWYGVFLKKTLKRVTHFFVQNKNSENVLRFNGFENVTVSGDTRFDRVNAQLAMDNQLDFIQDFKQERLCVVLGSTWPECEEVFVNAVNASNDAVCFVIAPHEIKEEKIKNLVSQLKGKVSLYSKGIESDSKILIIDTIGYLTRIYSYADIAYVGGGYGNSGLHNILEPAVFGTPIIVGPNTEKFPEAKALKKVGGLKEVKTSQEFKTTLTNLILESTYRRQMSNASMDFVKNRVGATAIILDSLN